AGDKAHPVQPAEVAVNERVAGLRLVWSAFGKAEMPGGVLVPRMGLQVRVLLLCARLHVLPARPEHVLARVDQPFRVPDRDVIHDVGGHTRDSRRTAETYAPAHGRSRTPGGNPPRGCLLSPRLGQRSECHSTRFGY